jgi:hypothetical protein
MNRVRFALNFLTTITFVLVFAGMAQAQATRTWVSGVGDDVNPCSRTAPCKTFAGAISKTAKDGEINVIDPGGFGTINITKSITIDGNGNHASILASLVTGVIVNITDVNDVRKTVRIRNLSINGAATGVHGINFLAGSKLYVENCIIAGFQNSASSRGIRAALGTGAQVFVKDTTISNCASGMDFSTTSGIVVVVVDHVRLEGMTDGFIMQNGTGGTLRDSLISANSGVGVKLSGNAGVAIERTMISHNGTGLQPGAGTTTDLSNVTIQGNGTGIATTGGTVTSHGNNQIALNTTPGATPTGVGQQ